MHFMQPGALHRARWMARVIYAIKISLFCSQFVMKKRELANIKRYSVFAVSLYVRPWFVANVAVSAPANDLEFIKRLVTYEDKSISNAASTAFSRHLWYLSEIMILLAFFDPDTCFSEKRDMVKALDVAGSENPFKRINLDMSDVGERSIASFVTSSSLRFFELLHLPSEFLKSDPQEWDSRRDYQVAAKYVREMKVVNDCAERGVTLMQNYHIILTKNKDKKQFLPQVVEEHQRKYPKALKKTLKYTQTYRIFTALPVGLFHLCYCKSCFFIVSCILVSIDID